MSLRVQSLVWLTLGGLFHIFGFGLFTIPIAAWFVPLFLLRFTRGNTPLFATLGLWSAFFISNAIANMANFYVMPYPLYFAVIGLTSLLFVLPYLADFYIASRLPGFVATLVFPVAWVAMEFINGLMNPYGTWASLAYTQYGNLPLMQLVSITGIAGITFLICWFGSVFNWAWEANFQLNTVKKGVATFAGILIVVLVSGGARLAFAPTDVKAVRIVSIGTPGHIYDPYNVGQITKPIFFSSQYTHEQREKSLQALREIEEWHFENALREAHAGAKIITWPEAAAFVVDHDEEAFLQRARDFARKQQVYLLMGVGTFHPEKWPLADNKTILVTPAGEIAFTYHKARLVPITDTDFVVPGDGTIPTVDTSYGRIASVICYDMDFPAHIRQVGRSDTNILIVPTGDWQAVGSIHSHMAEFRAIENGVSMVRPARGGIFSAVDPYGRTLARMDEYATEQRVMVASVPYSSVRTLYPYIGDLFAWLCITGLLAAAMWAKMRSAVIN